MLWVFIEDAEGLCQENWKPGAKLSAQPLALHLNCEPSARAVAGFGSQGRVDMAGKGLACVLPPVPALCCLSPLQTSSSCAQLCARPGFVCLPHVWGLGCDRG